MEKIKTIAKVETWTSTQKRMDTLVPKHVFLRELNADFTKNLNNLTKPYKVVTERYIFIYIS